MSLSDHCREVIANTEWKIKKEKQKEILADAAFFLLCAAIVFVAYLLSEVDFNGCF